jgi:hypothetical protein
MSEKKKSAVKKAKKVSVREVVLKPKEVLRIVADKEVLPVVVQAAPDVVEVAAVPREQRLHAKPLLRGISANAAGLVCH